ncbi:MAG: ribonuclease J [Bdellovibrionota bacterium]
MTSKFQFWSLGGSGEVGMNSFFLRFGETVIPVDAGLLFADQNDFGIESLHADYSRFFLDYDPSCWLITHAHEDHIGAVAALIEAAASRLNGAVPKIYAPLFACELIKEKILDDQRYPQARRFVDRLVPIKSGEPIEVAEGLTVRFIETRHSTLQCHALAFEWIDDAGDTTRVLHTSDFKLDENSYEDGVIGLDAYDCFDGENPDFLFIDSTNAEREGHTVPEKTVLPNLRKLIASEEGRVYVSLFSSNIYRMAGIMRMARELGRTACLAGRSFNTAHRIARDHGFYGRICPDIKGADLINMDDAPRLEKRRQLVICSGSQGEKRSVLMRMSQGQHPNFKVETGDAVILSSKMIPGNEKSISRLINGLLRQGAKVHWGDSAKDLAGGPIHGSGHARRDEIHAVVERVNPRHVIPVHGELRQLMACADVAANACTASIHVCENLTRLDFEKQKGGEWGEPSRQSVPYEGRMLRFETFTAHSLDPFLRIRKRLAQSGLVSVCIDSAGRIQLACEGVSPSLGPDNERFNESLREQIIDWMHHRFLSLHREGVFKMQNRSRAENEVAEELSRVVRKIVGARPFVVVHCVGDG